MGDRDDHRLVELAKSGDQAAYAQLFARYRGPIFRLALQRLRDPFLAEDVVQETFVRARSSLSGYDSAKRLFPWLASIAMNRAADLWNKQRKLQPVGLLPDVASVSQFDVTWETAVNSLERDRLRRALGQLAPRQRRALLLHDLEGLPYADVASRVGTTQLAARSLVCRARATMRSVLETLGLVVIGLRRRLWRQSSEQSTTRAAQIAWGAATLTFSIVFGLAPLVPGFSQAASVQRRAAPNPIAGHPRRFVSSSEAGAGGRSGSTPSHSRRPENGGLRWKAAVSPPRPGAAAPSGGRLSVEVVAPNGQDLYYTRTWLDCRDVGRIPTGGPIRTAC